ncbi:hypothetical protein CAPTEDRAFT_211148 [Capitella teleta]|uniref:Uncharacterized protein n=1 Tax=Capitella teleta TaxID=283909 RepID=R7VDX3_CAPTE|nr:hypothetical protein CAPTEDRAFT_190753 [Capitella teleta]ELU16747.1 hypothetical protein CAPTEDRAFT_211148 [Capitella teleta]|eukprot:ELU02075.1 hypothetical protein CAPTEDRAFT_190753 [Capitella teleta]
MKEENKTQRANALRRMTAIMNETNALLGERTNVAKVKALLDIHHGYEAEYHTAHSAYMALVDEPGQLEKQRNKYSQRYKETAEFLQRTSKWVFDNDDLRSEGSSHATVSSRTKQRMRKAKLEVERDMLAKKLQLQNQQLHNQLEEL